MKRRKVEYTSVMAAGGLLLLVIPILFEPQMPGLVVLVFLALAIGAGWVRVNYEPSGRHTLSPILVFASCLMIHGYAPVMIAAFAAFASGAVFGRKPLAEALAEVSEEAVPALIMVIVFAQMRPTSPQVPVRAMTFLPALSAYFVARVTLAALHAKTVHGVRLRSFFEAAGWQMLANFGGFGIEALILAFLASAGGLGYLGPTLIVASLIEFYYPYKLLSDQEDTLLASLAMIAKAIDAKDPYTAEHSKNVSNIAVRLARAMGLTESDVRKIRVAALMHDIGKVGVRGSIIRKPGKLDAQEGQAMRQHPVISAEIMRPVEFLGEAAEVVRHHHEHIDGTGYPDGLKGTEIPLGSRVVLVADAFDALTTDRPYRKGRSKPEALAVIAAHEGTQFDATVVKALRSVIEVL
ncbi:MAG TPA: HD-GYP domain-containing protein [Nitrospiraceae bacterium]|nr:HD-GYP domain-containing protein [Nitrospiraceae bacterium]